jgi:hypothetical protein
MDRYYQANVSNTPPHPPVPGVNGFVQSDVPSDAFEPTEPGVWAINYVTESFLRVIIGAGLTPDVNNLHQLAEAVQIIATSGE